MGASRKRSKRERQEQDEWKVLFPFEDVELQCGRKVTVQQWNIQTGAVLTPRVVSLLDRLRTENLSGEVELDDLVRVALSECLDIVAVTIGWTVEELEARATFDDFLSLLQVVIDQSLVRKDGGGALPKVVELVGALQSLTEPSQPPPPSISSSDADTPSPTSGA